MVHSVLIIEPNSNITVPYSYFKNASITRSETVEKALDFLSPMPDIICLSASYSISKLLNILEIIKHNSAEGLTPLLFIVDLSKPVSNLPGTQWAGKAGIVSSISSKQEFDSTIHRVISA